MAKKEKTIISANEKAPKMTFSKKELKMPEEHFGETALDTRPSFLGIIVALLILVVMITLGGLYLWSEELQKQAVVIPPPDVIRPTAAENNEPESNNAEADVETMQAMSTSDEIDAIEADLGSTNLDSVTSELIAIDEIVAE